MSTRSRADSIEIIIIFQIFAEYFAVANAYANQSQKLPLQMLEKVALCLMSSGPRAMSDQ